MVCLIMNIVQTKNVVQTFAESMLFPLETLKGAHDSQLHTSVGNMQ